MIDADTYMRRRAFCLLLINIFPLLLLVLFSFITDVKINTHILYHNSLMVLVGSGLMNGTSSESFWAKNYLKRCGL